MKQRILALVLALCALLALCGCPAGEQPAETNAHPLTSPSIDTYHCAENGVTYRRAPGVYLPMTLGREPFAYYENEGGMRFFFYPLSEGSTDDYLMQADEEDLYPYYMIAREDYVLPSLADMDPYRVIICSAEEAEFWLAPNVYDQIRTIEKVRAIVRAYEAGESATLPLGEPTVQVELLFVSTEYADFAYNCSYYEYADGSCYFNEMATGRCVRVEGGLFDGFCLTPEGH